MPEGCQYRETQTSTKCLKVCEPGRPHCPYHELLLQSEAEERETRQNRSKAASNGRRAVRRLRSERMR